MAGDEGFREIHLDGKQLVFLFMAVTVVGVAIFLFGVMVGRGVRASTTPPVAVEPAAVVPSGDVAPPPDPQAQAKAAPPPANPPLPPTPADEPVPETAAGAGKTAEAARKVVPAPTPPADPSPSKPATNPAAASASSTDPTAPRWVVQVTALSDRAQAEAIVKRLAGKGYSAYLEPPPVGSALYRVRVGKFKERREADTVRRRLEKEEQFKNCFTTR